MRRKKENPEIIMVPGSTSHPCYCVKNTAESSFQWDHNEERRKPSFVAIGSLPLTLSGEIILLHTTGDVRKSQLLLCQEIKGNIEHDENKERRSTGIGLDTALVFFSGLIYNSASSTRSSRICNRASEDRELASLR
jgi:hypothetical protein